MDFLDGLRAKVRGKGIRIVYPEGREERALRAAAILRDQDLVRPILLGARGEIAERAKSLGVPLDGIEVRDPLTDEARPRFEAAYLKLRAHKGATPELAAQRMSLPHYFAAMMVREGEAAGFVSGLNSETKPFVPSFEIVQMAEGSKRASSVFFMVWPDKVYLYADCSVNINPDAVTLAEIGRATARTARSLGIEPRIAYLSFSTRDSAKDASIDKVKEAVRLVREAEPTLVVDGELQLDAAILPEVAKKKCPDSPLAGGANVFVFPDINAGNIAYKITERLAGAAAVGPIMQGLKKPVNDVSRGCSVQDFADVAVITAVQSLQS